METQEKMREFLGERQHLQQEAQVTSLLAREILDSRGNPTVEAEISLSCGVTGRASVPSGASTGSHEAHELRDGDVHRFHGKGVLRAIEHITNGVHKALQGKSFSSQRELDMLLCHLDGDARKANIGANAMLAVSLAYAKAVAKAENLPLWRSIGGARALRLPVPLMNIVNGGAHANNGLSIQEFMIVPLGFSSFKDALRCGSEIFWTLKRTLEKQGISTAVGDEGGFAPNHFTDARQVLDVLREAILASGYTPGREVFFALDVAATELLQKDGRYAFQGKNITAEELVYFYENLIYEYPIISIEDGLAEDDFHGWQMLCAALQKKIQLVGDDLFVTNVQRLQSSITRGIGNAILIKPNQAGTLTETLDAISLAQANNYRVVLSHRSGETEDTSIADIAVGVNAEQIKTGGPSRSERLAKYNQLLRIEEALGASAVFGGKDTFRALTSL